MSQRTDVMDAGRGAPARDPRPVRLGWAWARLALLGAGAAWMSVGVAGCGTEGQVDELAGRKREILAQIGEAVIVAGLSDVTAAASTLEEATATYAADPTDAHRTAAQAAGVATMDAWQLLEPLQVGPAGMSGVSGVRGGMDLRDEIYSWPTTSTCRIDQETAGEDHADPDAFSAKLVNVRGLDAMEYLLFAESTENTCSDLSPINADGTWDGLGAEQIRARRATYAHTLGVLVRRVAEQLAQSWQPGAGGFLVAWSRAGEESEVFDSPQHALDDMAGALLYMDTEVRDMKLAEPAGIVGCSMETCPDALESRFAHRSKDHILSNLRGFQRVFLGAAPGTEAAGLDDLLLDVGAAELAAQLTSALEDAIAAVEAIPGTLEEAIVANPAEVMAAYEAVGVAQRLFKVDVVTVLDLEPSTTRVGDND